MPYIGLRRPPAPATGPRLRVGSPVPQPDELGACTGPRHVRLIAFLRHVGCPFAEHAVKRLRSWARTHPEVIVTVVSHGDNDATQRWLRGLGGLGALQLVTDPTRQLHARWGLGESGLWHFAGPRSLAGVAALWPQGIRNRDATGTRWQRAGLFLVANGVITWVHVPRSAEGWACPPDHLCA